MVDLIDSVYAPDMVLLSMCAYRLQLCKLDVTQLKVLTAWVTTQGGTRTSTQHFKKHLEAEATHFEVLLSEFTLEKKSE